MTDGLRMRYLSPATGFLSVVGRLSYSTGGRIIGGKKRVSGLLSAVGRLSYRRAEGLSGIPASIGQKLNANNRNSVDLSGATASSGVFLATDAVTDVTSSRFGSTSASVVAPESCKRFGQAHLSRHRLPPKGRPNLWAGASRHTHVRS